MRAKSVNEDINFERTGNPKRSMGIGGISLSRTRKDFIDQARIEWIDWIEKNVVGRTITAKMNKLQKKTKDGYEFDGGNWGEYTINVDGYQGETNMDDPAIMLLGDDSWVYALPIDDTNIYLK